MKSIDFCALLKKHGLTFLSGVPCSIFRNILIDIENDADFTYIPAVREDGALGIAAGGSLSGKRSGILIQNSGLGNVINGLTSLNLIYKIPVFMIISWRGYQGKDAPEHIIMGAEMTNFLETMNIPYKVFEEDNFERVISELSVTMDSLKTPVAAILKDGLIE